MAEVCFRDECDEAAIGYIAWAGSGDPEMDANTPQVDQPVCEEHRETLSMKFSVRPLR